MRLVGANTAFISRPFLWRSVAYGALGGVLASALTLIAVWVFGNQFGIDLLANEHWIWYGAIAVVLVVAGVVIAWLSTAFTVRRYINRN